VPDETVEAMISCQVLEHLERPLDALTEAHRALKKGGLFFIAFPFMYPLHAAPRDYTRFTYFAMDNELKKRGFEILEREHIGGFWFCMAMYVRIYLQNFDRGVIKKIKIIPVLIWLQQLFFWILHSLEEFALNLVGKKPGALRDVWTINYIYVVKKI
jgi:SAM-dependent methyltransferase